MSVQSGNSRSRYNSNQDQRNYVNLNEVFSGNKPASYKGSRQSDAGSVFSDNASLPKQIPPTRQTATLPEQNGNNWFTPRSSIRSNQSLQNDRSRNDQKMNKSNFILRNRKDSSGLAPISEDSIELSVADAVKLCAHFNIDVSINALAYLQHKTYQNNALKLDVFDHNGLQTILEQTCNPNTQVALPALGLLKNMSYSDDIRISKEIERLGGIQMMTKLVEIYSNQIHTNMKPGSSEYCRELAVDVLWNLSSITDLKQVIEQNAIRPLILYVLLKDCQLEKDVTGNYVAISEKFDIYWSIALANSLGIIRNINYENKTARMRLRNEDGLVDCLVYILQSIVAASDDEVSEKIDGKIVENTTCILRNLTFSIQEIADNKYLKSTENRYSVSNNNNTESRGNKFGTFNKSVKKGFLSKDSESEKQTQAHIPTPASTGVPKGMELLWDSSLMASSLSPIVRLSCGVVALEAACGIIQNLTAGNWQPSINMRQKMREQELLKPLIELIQLGTVEVIRSAATALRNISEEPDSCRQLRDIGLKKFVEQLPDLSNNKPIMNGEDDKSNSSPTSVAALLSLIYTVIKDSPQYICYFVDFGGANRCVLLRNSREFIDTRPHNPYPYKVFSFSQCILNLIKKTPNAYKLAIDKWKLTSNHFIEPNNNQNSKQTGISNSNLQSNDNNGYRSDENDPDADNRRMDKMINTNNGVGNNLGGSNRDDRGQPFMTNAGLQQRSSIARSATGSAGQRRSSAAPNNYFKTNNENPQPNAPQSNDYYTPNSNQRLNSSNNYQVAPISPDASEYPSQPPRYSDQFNGNSMSERPIIPSNNARVHSNRPPSVVNNTPRASVAGSYYSRTGKTPFGPQFQPKSYGYRTSMASSVVSNRIPRNMPSVPSGYNRYSTTSSVKSELNHEYSIPSKQISLTDFTTRPIKTPTNSIGQNNYPMSAPSPKLFAQRKESNSWV